MSSAIGSLTSALDCLNSCKSLKYSQSGRSFIQPVYEAFAANSDMCLSFLRQCADYGEKVFALMRQVPAMRASEQLEAAWDREVGVPPGVRMDSKMGCSSHTGLATQKQRVGAHARAPLRSAVRPWAGEGM